MPHLPDDDGLVPPLKVLRKRLNGVYREDLGFSGPTRRYVVMVALLVGLASVPTLAVITTGSGEISGPDRPGAMEVPFLPPPVTGPIRPAPAPSTSTSAPAPAPTPAPAEPPEKDHSGGYSGDNRKFSQPEKRSTRSRSADPVSVRPPRPPRQSRSLKAAKRTPPARSVTDRRIVSKLPGLPIVPGLPVVPEEDDVSRPHPPTGFPSIPDLPEVPPDAEEPPVRQTPGEPDEPHPARRRPCADAAAPEPWSHRRAERTTEVPAPAGDPPGSPVHNSHSRRSAVTERPHNIRAARILEQSYPAGGGNIRHSMAQPRSDEHRSTNRPYRGQHRAEHSNHTDERSAARQRSSRVGRHHAEPLDDHYTNHR